VCANRLQWPASAQPILPAGDHRLLMGYNASADADGQEFIESTHRACVPPKLFAQRW
jgi:hypothetical protein